jgi:hypothetical protein
LQFFNLQGTEFEILAYVAVAMLLGAIIGVLAEKCHPPRFQSLSVSTTFEVCIKTPEIVSSRRQSAIHPELGPTAGGA